MSFHSNQIMDYFIFSLVKLENVAPYDWLKLYSIDKHFDSNSEAVNSELFLLHDSNMLNLISSNHSTQIMFHANIFHGSLDTFCK